MTDHLIAIAPDMLHAATLAQAPEGQDLPGWLAAIINFAPFILIIVIFYVFIIGARRKEQKQKQQMLDSIKKNDRIQTIGGMFGTVFDVRDDRVQIKIDESTNTKVWIARNAVHQVVTEKDKVDKK